MEYESPTGLWLPLITPFRDGELDERSLRRLLRHYDRQPVDGLIVCATTGEGMTLDEAETRAVADMALVELGGRMPVYLGVSGADTRKLAKTLRAADDWGLDGYLVPCPYYVRPSQAGLEAHFAALADATSKAVAIYNIPYRTGVNLGNDAMLRLAERANIVGVKDCCADPAQSFDLTRRRPAGFSVLTGEDAFFHAALAQGADGGILASAHIRTAAFAEVLRLSRAGDAAASLAAWRALADLPPLLFAEPNPAPVKHWLWRMGLIDSPELRLPMAGVSDALAARIDAAVEAAVAPA